MKKLFLLAITAAASASAHCQIARDFLVTVQADLIRSDHDGYFEKIQSGLEVHYFISRKVTAHTGVEFWTDGAEASVLMGARWYPIPEAFVRVRGLIGANEIGVGAGWAKPLNENWKFEAMADAYTDGYLAIRAGFARVFRRKAG